MDVRMLEKKEAVGSAPEAVAAGRAARDLELRRGEFDLAVQLGHIRTVREGSLGRRLVSRQEIDRLRAAEGFPHALRERVRTVGTAEGADLLALSPGRFTRLARAGYIAPVRFFLNRYRAVVWLYLADEVRAFAEKEPALLAGRFPRTLTVGRDAEEDWRPRTWRSRRVGRLLHLSDDPWERAAVIASVLGPVQLSGLVRDPYERAYLDRLRPGPVPGRADSEAAQTEMRRLLVAERADEIAGHRTSLGALVEAARRVRPAPRPGHCLPPLPAGATPGSGGTTPVPVPSVAAEALSHRPSRHAAGRGLLTRLRSRRGGEPGRTVRT